MSEVLVLYQISNEKSDGGYNAYYISRKNGVTLSTVKQSCRALQSINANGSDGYHWRVRIDEKPNTSHSSTGSSSGGGSSGGSPSYSWWDVQDENARLPVTEATPSELKRMLMPKKVTESSDVVTQEVTKAAKGAMKYMGKAMNAVSGTSSGGHGHHGGDDMDDDLHAVRTPVICFKLLDLGRVQQSLDGRSGGNSGGGVRRPVAPRSRPVRKASSVSQQSQSTSQPLQQQRKPRVSAPISAGAPRIPAHQQRTSAVPKSTPPTADLMGFNTNAASTTANNVNRNLQHASSMPSVSTTPTGAIPGETRAEKLKREYAKKNATSNRVWDDIDQRWVEAGAQNGETKSLSKSNSSVSNNGGGVETATAAVKGISLSRSNAVGKSANVQNAVEARITDMEDSQQKAIAELRTREAEKAKAENEEDVVRQRLEPKLKAWAEEHGQKKQLRALLANLHTILWEGSGWKQVSLADVLDDSKVKRVYFKASRVVHPDKTGHLDAEKRFVAKRAFDALTQAKVEWDNGKR